MAAQDKSIKSFIGSRISQKQYKLFLATAKTPEAKRAIKNLYLSEPLKVFAKNAEQADTAADKITAALEA